MPFNLPYHKASTYPFIQLLKFNKFRSKERISDTGTGADVADGPWTAEDDWEGWKYLTSKIGDTVQLVGDDLFVTQEKILQKGIDDNCANSILIKVNQVGSISETIETMKLFSFSTLVT